jgi:hypothetical protein
LYETFNKSRTFPFLRAFINTLPEKVLKNWAIYGLLKVAASSISLSVTLIGAR